MAAVARHPLSLMSCVREPPPSSPTTSSPPDPFNDHKKCNTGAGNSFRPLRGLRRIFRRKPRATAPALAPPSTPSESTTPAPVSAAVGTCATPEYLGRSLPGRSVSHDSVFTTEAVASSEQSASPSASDSAHSLQQLVSPTSAAVAAELVGALRRRGQCRDSAEDNAVKQDQNTCINGSSLSVASSNIEEEWVLGGGVPSSLLVSSSLPIDKSPSPVELEGVVSITAPLSHTAARHKMAVKPRRNHGGPSRAGRRPHQVSTPSLPTTPELNEDSPVESSDSKYFNDADPNRGSGFFSGVSRAGSATPPSPEPEPVHGPSVAHQLKSASLPPGLALRPVAVTRSRSSATYHQTTRENLAKYPRSGSSEQLADRTNHRDPERRDKEKSFFSRLLSRRSGKKKKKKDPDDNPAGPDAYLSVYANQDAEASFTPRRMDERGRYAEGTATAPALTTTTGPQYTANKQNKVSSVARTGPAARQRADPQTIPISRTTDGDSGDEEVRPRYDKASPLEGVPIPVKPEGAVTRMQISYSTSPTKPAWTNHFSCDEDLESKSKVRLPALSAFQKRVSAVASMKESDDAESRSVRSEIDSLDVPPPPKTTSQDSLSCPNDNYSDVMEHFEQEMNSISLAQKGDSSCGSVDSLEPTKSEQPDHLTQTLLVALESVGRNGDADMPSLDSIENQERSSLRAEDGHGMYQVTIPFGSDGVSITHRVMDLEESAENGHSVTVACGPPPSASLPNITLISLTDIQQGIEKDENDVSVRIETRLGDKIETKHAEKIETYLPEKVETKHNDKVEKQPEKSEIRLAEKVQARQPEKTESEKAPEKTEKREKPVIPEKPDFASEEIGVHHRTEDKPRPPVARKSVILEERPAVPEFMRVQLNHVDSKPSVNVVLSTLSLDEKKRDDEELDREDTKKEDRRKSVEMIEAACAEKNVAVESSIVFETIVDSRNGLPPKEAPSLNPPTLEHKVDEVPVPSTSPVKPHKPFPLPANQKPNLTPPAKKSPVKKVPSKPDVLKLSESPTEPINKLLLEERDKMVIVEKKKPASPTAEEPVVLRRPSKEISRDEGAKSWDPALTVHSEVVLRKKSLSREVGSKKDDECELMKVFARRSLKVKDGDEAFVISQAWNTESSPDSPQEKPDEKPNRSRDSDKENDGAESPKDERKKEPKSASNAFKNEIIKPEMKKDSLHEKRLRIRNIADVPNSEKTTEKAKFVRAAVLRSESVEEKVVAPPEIEVPPKVASRWMPPVSTAPAPSSTAPAPAPDAASLPRFKRIQQRKEEWEQRAQQAAGKAAP